MLRAILEKGTFDWDKLRTDVSSGQHKRSTHPFGEGWWILSSGEDIEVSDEFGGGSNDHVGFLGIEKYGKRLGLDPEEIRAMREFQTSGEYKPGVTKAQFRPFSNGHVRVRVFGDELAITSQAIDEHTLHMVREFVLSKKINFGRVLWETVDGEIVKTYSKEQFFDLTLQEEQTKSV